MEATRAFIAKFANPWEQLTFQYSATHAQAAGKFNVHEDRYLLCLAHKFGYGNWDQVKAAIRRSDRFRFDYFLRSCNAADLGKRCEALMKAAEKENLEWDKRQNQLSHDRRDQSEREAEEERRVAEERERASKLGDFQSRLAEETRKLADLRNNKGKLRQGLADATAAGANGGGPMDGGGAAGDNYSRQMASLAREQHGGHGGGGGG
ncbi:unnamed protein product, partial [Phaeothamnion confervicola]